MGYWNDKIRSKDPGRTTEAIVRWKSATGTASVKNTHRFVVPGVFSFCEDRVCRFFSSIVDGDRVLTDAVPGGKRRVVNR